MWNASSISVSVSSNTTVETPISLPEFQTTYGSADKTYSWGPKLESEAPNYAREFYRTGWTTNNSVSISGGAENLRAYFSYGNVSSGGITPENGLTSPESNEALIKQLTMEHTARRYVLADATKFDNTSLVRFGAFDSATIVTCGDVPEKYKSFENVVEVAR